MLPIPSAGGSTIGQLVLTLLVALAPAAIAWWNDRRLVSKRDDPALPELLANRRRLNVRTIAVAVAVMIIVSGAQAAWGIPLLIALLIAAAYPLRTRLLGETWGFGAFLWYTAASIVGGFGFWIALGYAPIVTQRIVDSIGMGRWWLVLLLAAALIAVLVVWEAWYPRIWIWTHAGTPLTNPELRRRFDEIVRRAGTIVPQVYRVGPQGSRFVNAVALPSARQPRVAMGDALLELLEPDEAAAIFAHEVAHFDHYTPRRVRRTQLLNRALIVIGVSLPLVAAFAHITWERWIGWVWPFLVLVALGRRAAKSQKHETDSDLRAAALCGDPEALVRGLMKLHLHARIPRRYAADIERAASHPSLVRRIQAIRAGGAAAVEQLGAATVVRSTREGSWVVFDSTRSYWLDGVPDGTDAHLATLRDAASSYRAVNYDDLVELRVAAASDARTIMARTRRGDRWSVPIAADDVARVQQTLDVVDLRLGKPGSAPPRGAPAILALSAFVVSFLSGQAGVVLAPILIAMRKPGASTLAALGAMSVVRAVLGAAEGTSWLDKDLARLGLVGMAVIGAFAIYTAVCLVRAGQSRAHFRLTVGVLVGVTAIVAAMVVAQAVREPTVSLVGTPMLGTLGTALAGLAAALFTVGAPWSRPTGYAGFALALVVVALGVDREAWRLRRALTEDTARITLVATTELGGPARGLRVSPDGTHFLVFRSPAGYRAAAAGKVSIVAGRIGGAVREVVGVDGEFVADGRLLMMNVLDNGIELRLESVDSGAADVWADTIARVSMTDPRLVVDRGAGSWAIVGSEADSDRTTVIAGKVGMKGAARRAAIPDTLPVIGNEPMVFDDGATVIVPGYGHLPRATDSFPVLSLWSLTFFNLDGPPMHLWRVHGDSVRAIASIRGSAQCGEPLGGAAVCAAHRLSGTSLYVVTSTGAEEVAQLSLDDFSAIAPGPGLRAASMSINRGVVSIDLAARRLTRVAIPPNTPFATEVRVGSGWIVALGFDSSQRSAVRAYRVIAGRP